MKEVDNHKSKLRLENLIIANSNEVVSEEWPWGGILRKKLENTATAAADFDDNSIIQINPSRYIDSLGDHFKNICAQVAEDWLTAITTSPDTIHQGISLFSVAGGDAHDKSSASEHVRDEVETNDDGGDELEYCWEDLACHGDEELGSVAQLAGKNISYKKKLGRAFTWRWRTADNESSSAEETNTNRLLTIKDSSREFEWDLL